MKTGLRLLAAASFATLLAAGPASAAGLVTNGGFETGDFSGWTRDGNLSSTYVGTGGYAHTGTYGAALGPVGSNGVLSQTLTTVAGQAYDLSFWHFYPGGTPNYFAVTWNGTNVYGPDVNTTSPTTYTQYSRTVVGTGSDVLSFIFRNDPSYQGLDDVSVLASTSVAGPAPEPATWAMMIVGFGFAGTALRRRQKVSTRVSFA